MNRNIFSYAAQREQDEPDYDAIDQPGNRQPLEQCAACHVWHRVWQHRLVSHPRPPLNPRNPIQTRSFATRSSSVSRIRMTLKVDPSTSTSAARGRLL